MDIYIKQAENLNRLAIEENSKTPLNYGIRDKYIKDAISFFEKAFNENPDTGDIYLKSGKLHLLLKDKIGACQDFEKAKDLGNEEALVMFGKYCSV
jgi:tetratricopeptide (TPR) repeat protein